MSTEECLAPLAAESFFLTRYRSKPLPEHIDAFHYRVRARHLSTEREASVLARLALRLSNVNGGIPCVRLSGKTLVCLEELSNVATGDESLSLEPVDRAPLTYRIAAGRRALLALVRGQLKRQAADHGFVVGIADYVLSPRFRLKNAAGTVGLQTGVVFSLSLDGNNSLVLDCDMRSKILRLELFSEQLKRLPIVSREYTVSSLRLAESLVVEEVLAQKVSDLDHRLGMSVLDYNRERNRYRDDFEVEEDCPVVACRIEDGSKRYHYDPQLLHEILTIRQVRSIDRDFAERLADAMRMDTVERERFCGYFVRQTTGGALTWLSLSPQPVRVGLGNDYRAFDVALPRDNLLVGAGMRARSVESGVVEHGLYQVPSHLRLGLLAPANHQRAAQTRVNRLLAGMVELCREQTVFELVFSDCYEGNNPFKLRSAVAELAASPAELALVVLPKRGEPSPYVILKSELAKRRFPSQMLHVDTGLSRRETVNVLVGLMAKNGQTENWRIDKLLWPPDLFIGLSASSLGDERMAAVATAFDCTGRALDVTVELFSEAGQHIPESRLLHLLEGALLAYRTVHGSLPTSVVIHRDGSFVEKTYRRVWKHFKELGVAMTLVAIDADLSPRIGRIRGDRRLPPEPGTTILTGETSGLVITSSTRGLRGCPRPVAFERVFGLVDARALGGHIYWLSRAHVGSITPPRLPVTVHFARKVLAMVSQGLVPQGTMGSRMLFV